MITTSSSQNPPTKEQQEAIADFLFNHLGSYGDPKEHILKAIRYALKADNKPGGLLITSWDQEIMTGAVIINKTGMESYIPENILVYIATHQAYRGKGLGKELMLKAIELSEGGIALHVDADNPARKLYERLGFVNKYLEMRLIK